MLAQICMFVQTYAITTYALCVIMHILCADSGSVPGVTSGAFPEGRHRGWLQKEGGNTALTKTYELRWCIIANKQMSYYKKREDKKTAGLIHGHA